jgi:hypothetical protein
MKDWTDIEARKSAVEAFVKHVFANNDDRLRAGRDRCFAKQLFARLGEFEIEGSQTDPTKIPAHMELRVYEQSTTRERDEELGVVLLPQTLQGAVDVTDVWRCTWVDWTSLQSKTLKLESARPKT